MKSFSALFHLAFPAILVLWIIKKKNSFYGFTSQQPRYAFVKIGGKLEPYVNLNVRHLVVIKVMLWMIETHCALPEYSPMDTATLTQIGVKTLKKSKGFLLMNRVIHRLTKNTYAIILSALMDSEESPYKKLIFHKLQAIYFTTSLSVCGLVWMWVLFFFEATKILSWRVGFLGCSVLNLRFMSDGKCSTGVTNKIWRNKCFVKQHLSVKSFVS